MSYLSPMETLLLVGIIICSILVVIGTIDFRRKLYKARMNKGVPQKLIFGGTITILNEK